jgi:endonuclease-3
MAADPGSMVGGTYTLVLERDVGATIEVGALGEHEFPAGWYVYTGSALGPGGFARVERHRAVADGENTGSAKPPRALARSARENDTRHWHVDHLLGYPGTTIERVVRSADVDAECAIARVLPGRRVPGFGASDRECGSHLAHASERDRLPEAVWRTHREYGDGSR